MLGIEGSYPFGYSEENLDSCARKVRKISCKTFPRKT